MRITTLGRERYDLTLDTIGSSGPPFLTRKLSSSYYLVFLGVLFLAMFCPPISTLSIDEQGSTFNCSSNLFCLQSAHVSNGSSQFEGLSLLSESPVLSDVGLAYYYQQVRLLDNATQQSASFNTSFGVNTVLGDQGFSADGFTFLISADNKNNGSSGEFLGIFDTGSGNTPFTCIVIEFDSFDNEGPPAFDISNNHVSIDFNQIDWTAAANASTVNVTLGDSSGESGPVYAWIEYSSQNQLLEVRVSNQVSRPSSAVLNYTVDLFKVVEEYMWVGFSASSGGDPANYVVVDWTFESFGIPDVLPPSPAPSPAPILPPSPAPSPAPSRDSRPTRHVGLIVGISVGVLSLILACIFIVVLVRRRTSSADPIAEDLTVLLEGMPERYSYKQLSVATGNFSNDTKLGEGGFGSVHRGVLPSGIAMAVKKINENSNQGEREFMAEVSIISHLKHRNLIQLLGWCRDPARRNYLLVYELMPNGSLDKVLFGPAMEKTTGLSWPQRFNIVRGTAAALDYLHQGWTQQVIHRDIKSSNIMLDEKWNAKLGDFGLARLVDHERTAATTVVAGTHGYIAPEVAVSGKFTDKSDVYAFGAVVLEVACGRQALATHLPEGEKLLVDWVWQRLSEGDVLSTVDKRLEGYDTYWMEVMLKVGLYCSHPNPLARPTMRHVVQILAGDVPVPSVPASKPVLEFSSDIQRLSVEELESLFIETKSRSRPKLQVPTKVGLDSLGENAVHSFGISSTSSSLF